jgi:PAS domain S-box-containing protein
LLLENWRLRFSGRSVFAGKGAGGMKVGLDDCSRAAAQEQDNAFARDGARAVPDSDSGNGRVPPLFDAVQALVMVLDREGRILHFNRACEALTGYMREEVRDCPFWDLFVAAEERDEARGLFSRALSSPAPALQASHWIVWDGSRRLTHWSFVSLGDSRGRPDTIVATGRAAQFEQALCESEARYQRLFDAVPVGIFHARPDGQVLEANQALVEMLRYPDRETLLRANAREYYIDPKEREQLREALEREGRVHNFEARLRRRDGSSLWARLSATAERDASGLMTLWHGTIEDITGHKQDEESLRQNEERFRSLVQHSSDVIAILEPDGMIRYVSPSLERILGYRPDDLIDRNLFSLVHPEELSSIRETFAKMAEGGDMLLYATLRLRHRDESWRALECIGSNQMTHPAIRGIVMNSRDITPRRQAEEAARQRENQLAVILDTLPVGVWVIDATGRIVLSNPAGRQIWCGNQSVEIEHFSERKGFWASTGRPVAPDQWGLARAIRDGETSREEIVDIECFDGTRKTILNSAAPILNAWGEIEGAVAVNEDITDYRRAQQAARRLAAIVECSEDAILSKTLDGRIVSWNAAAERLYGYTAEEAIGQSIEFLIPPDRLDEARGVLERIARGEHSRHYETQRIRKDGARLDVFVTISPIRDSNGRIAGASSIMRDITENKRVEQALLESEKRYRTVVRATQDAVYDLDLASGAMWMNEQLQTQFGYEIDPDDLSHAWWTERLHPEDKARVEASLQAAIADGDTFWSKEYRFRRPDATYAYVFERGYILRDANGSPLRMIGSMMDITTRHWAEQHLRNAVADLERSNRELEQFAYVASHDLQEPLRMIASYTQLLALNYRNQLDPDALEFIDYAMDGANRMQLLINDLLAYSRVGTRGRPCQPTDLHSALGYAMANLAVAVQESGAVVINTELPTAPADASQITQLFQNLIGNAIKFRGSATPRILVSAQRRGADWQISIRDNGIGIEPRHHDRIFQIFQRLLNRKDCPGTGIGLALCKRIVERHGGRIWVESESGKGATFHFTIPAERGNAP